ncbi:O-antigen ligase family protein [Salinisphaera sp. SPP-AMP-43]|uniref:O-antigen ligase family protein n=1 Tax=Salinisphaera sp. SPP-AMP-43 TaxID=3121288 RepID=UPI003C6E272D
MVLDRVSKFTLFLAPTGIFFLPLSALGSFRAFYIPLVILNAWAIARLSARQLAEFGVLLLIAAVFWASASYGYVSFVLIPEGLSSNPFVRWLVIVNLMFGFYFIGCWLSEARNSEEWFARLDFSYRGFVLVFLLGFVLYAGVVFGPVPATLYEHVVTVEQSAFGYLRFSPGTYPNEFGTLCSFFALFALIKNSRQGGTASLLVALMALIGIALASTRSAYVTLIVGVLIVLVGIPSLKRRTQIMGAILFAIPLGLLLLNFLGFNFLAVLKGGFDAALNPNQGSLGERLQGWASAASQFVNFPFLGFGFESPNISFLHNLFLQEIFGLGLVGCALLILLSMAFWVLRKTNLDKTFECSSFSEERYVFLIRIIALEHTVLFGLNNHNQSHFLTWLTFALFVSNMTVDLGGKIALSQAKGRR